MKITNTIIKSSAKKNEGSDIPIIVKTVTVLSKRLFFFTAAVIPKGIEIKKAKRKPQIFILKDRFIYVPINSFTGLLYFTE